MSRLTKLHDHALDHEHDIIRDTEMLTELRFRMYQNNDPKVLEEIQPVLNAIIEDATHYKEWIKEQLKNGDTT